MGGESRDSRTEIPWFCKSSEKACQGRLTSVLSVLTMNVKYRASGEESVYIALWFTVDVGPRVPLSQQGQGALLYFGQRAGISIKCWWQ